MQIKPLLKSLQTQLLDNKSFLFFLVLGSLSSLLWIIGDTSLNALMYNRTAIVDGEYWRVITGHLVHSNGWHLLLNLASLFMIGLLFSQHLSIRFWLISFLSSAMIISGCYYWIAPEYHYYVGLSAVLYGVIIIGALLDLKQQPLIALLILVVVTGRVIWQQYSGSMDSLADLIEDRVAIESHLFGICSGYVIGLVLVVKQRYLDFQPVKD
ncbi:MAG: rhombosortase [Gammaproteobacteria bacterium]|nr:MAG: rhombosortase [Gammaproteobacteria bacterium]